MRGDFFFFYFVPVKRVLSTRCTRLLLLLLLPPRCGKFFCPHRGFDAPRSSRYRSNLSVYLSRVYTRRQSTTSPHWILAASLYTLDVYRVTFFFLFIFYFYFSLFFFFFFTFTHFRSILRFERYERERDDKNRYVLTTMPFLNWRNL